MRTITVAEYASKGVPEGAKVFISTHAGRKQVAYLRWWPEDPWVVTGSGINTESWCVHGGTTLEVEE